MKFTELELQGAYLVQPEPRSDERGLFARVFCEREFGAQGLQTSWKQCNTSMSVLKGTVRGLHFQRPPHAEVKLVRCTAGAIFDAIVDLRAGSSTYGKWCGIRLDPENRDMLYVPAGFAHGFQTLQDLTEVHYMVSAFYEPTAEGGLRYDDPAIGINWPETVTVVSDRDRLHPDLAGQVPIDLYAGA